MKFFQITAYILTFLFAVSCTKNNDSLSDSRAFEFTYQVSLEPSQQKVELWFPIAKTNETQVISNESLDSGQLTCEKHVEQIHSNHYYYCYSNEGLPESMTLTYKVDVKRYEHNEIDYANLNPDNYDKGTDNLTVPEGNVFQEIIDENNLTSSDMRGVYYYVLNGMHYGKPTGDKDNPNYKYISGGINKNTGKEWLPKDITYLSLIHI